MSNLYKSAMHARISKLPDLPPLPPDSEWHTSMPGAVPVPDLNDEDEEEQEEREAADALGLLPAGSGMGPPAMPRSLNNMAQRRLNRQRKPKPPNPEFAPISAAGFFQEALQVVAPSRKLDFRVYHTPGITTGVGGGGLMICHHGAGYSGLSFACFAKEVAAMTKGECGVLAFDARRHGKTISLDGHDEDLSITVLVDDLVAIVQTIFPDPARAPSFVFVGHSMGGSVVVQACPLLQDLKYRVSGVAVLDVVEGSAMDALPHMHSLLNARPDGFDSVEEGIEWHFNTNTIRNSHSARVSIPSILKHEPNATVLPPWQWRTPLRSTAPYWPSWFTGLSSKFLAARTARVLILAGTDRLDKELMIGQMQGKFQQVVVPSVGHMLHEDEPTRLAEILVDFWKRNERVVIGVKKVGEL
ncbi:Alpha/Beta hydrolase protein [Coprinopsis sp. MPI-PUGE-AT-0042]|nr:Alpha/Beta hydrolase protein [Coprinopsis sp. MPI-PUGE-AT-0042]